MEIIINNTPPTPSLGHDEYVIVKSAGNDLLIVNRTNAKLAFEIKVDLQKPAGIAGGPINPNDSKLVSMYSNYKHKGKTLYIKYSMYEVVQLKTRIKTISLGIEKNFSFIY